MRQALTWAARRSAFGHKVLFPILVAAAFVLGGAAPSSANPKYAAIVIDANTGKTLYSSNADAPRYPASLTKMMTLYMVFEALERGKIKKSSRIPFSANAAAEPPTKLGIKAGGSISVEDAIYALVTKSANDVSTAVAEFLGGSEQRFARMMTDKARALGMRKTTFRNAHGLPNNEQRTTARDMATLGIALREHYPQYYGYFSTRSVTVAGKIKLRSHNRLLGQVKGVDGIKTGYIRASGFNLVSSVKSGDRSLVAVVMGGRTAKSRDNHMAALIREHLPKASRRDTGPLVASRKTIAPSEIVAAGAGAFVLPVDVPTPDLRPTDSIAAFAAVKPAGKSSIAAAAAVAQQPVSAPRPRVEVAKAEILLEEETGEGDIDIASQTIPSGWVIQVASTGSEAEARDVLSRTTQRAGSILASATPFTEPFSKDGVQYVRARFAGFASKDAAWDACGALKKKDIACYAVAQ